MDLEDIVLVSYMQRTLMFRYEMEVTCYNLILQIDENTRTKQLSKQLSKQLLKT